MFSFAALRIEKVHSVTHPYTSGSSEYISQYTKVGKHIKEEFI